MQINEVINRIKKYCKGSWNGTEINDDNTRDKVLYGNPNAECTGIVTTIYASIEVIRKAHDIGTNLIIVHEALFWNRGDTRDWLEEEKNITYLAKKKLLDDFNIVVWRFHDYMHSGIPYKNDYIDGIFYGVAMETGWLDAKISGNLFEALYVECDETTPKQVADHIIKTWNLNGVKVIGNLDAKVNKIMVCGHIQEGQDIKPLINKINKENINLLLPLELIDFTLTEYIKDSGQLGQDKAIISTGHFNLEEPGMKYMLNWIDDALNEHINCTFIQAGDMYEYITK